jgi:hypothetical protein
MGGAGTRRTRESDEESDEDYAPPRKVRLEQERADQLRRAAMERDVQLQAEREAEAAQRKAEARQAQLAACDAAWLAALAQNENGAGLHHLGVCCVMAIAENDDDKLVAFLELVPLDKRARWALVSRRWRRAAPRRPRARRRLRHKAQCSIFHTRCKTTLVM